MKTKKTLQERYNAYSENRLKQAEEEQIDVHEFQRWFVSDPVRQQLSEAMGKVRRARKPATRQQRIAEAEQLFDKFGL